MITTSTCVGDGTVFPKVVSIDDWLPGYDAAELVEAIVGTIEPESWLNGPGSLPIQVVNRRIVVTQYAYVHASMERLMYDLRTSQKDHLKGVPGPSGATSGAAWEAEQLLLRKMETLVDFQCTDEPLKDVLRALAEKYDLQIWLDEAKISDEGIATDHPVSANLEHVRLDAVFEALLTPLELTWLPRDEVMKITTTVAAGERLHACVYHTVGCRQPDRWEDMIMSAIDPDSWDAEGGPAAVRFVHDRLIVRQTSENHRRIKRLLEELCPVNVADDVEKASLTPRNHFILRTYYVTEPDRLTSMIPKMISPESWSDERGGIVAAVNGELRIRQTAEVHRRIAWLVEKFTKPPGRQGNGCMF